MSRTSPSRVERVDDAAAAPIVIRERAVLPTRGQYRVSTIDFNTGEPAGRRYTRAKVIDMVFSIEGSGV